MTFYHTERAVEQVIHHFKLELLPRCLKSSLRLFQHIFGPIVFVHIITNITHSSKMLSPFLIEVVAFNTDDEVVQDDTNASPHDDDLVLLGVDKQDADLLERLKCSLEQAYRMLNSYMYL